jgi:ATP-dependent exoDNAse (exonuclease V) alpha subunit
VYSINAFGAGTLTSYADPPDFFDAGSTRREWDLPPSTVCVWPYEEMYRDEVRGQYGYDNDLRLKYAQDFFAKIESNVSLIFYYANYSNPLSTDEAPRYALVGLSRVKDVGEHLYYEGCNEETKRKFGGAYVWDRNITSQYPDHGLRLPYHQYLNDPRLDAFALFPEDAQQCKYGSKLLTDDQALGLVEQFLRSVQTLQEMGDTNEDWGVRRAWLEGLIAELWQRRGAYPGLPAVCQILKFSEAIPFFKEESGKGNELKAAQAIWDVIEGKAIKLGSNTVQQTTRESVRRQWGMQSDGKTLLKDILTRIDLTADEVGRIMGIKRLEHGLHASNEDIAANPYLLVEQYVGTSTDDRIAWSLVDRGIIPSPEVGVPSLMEYDAPQRLRALVVECLQRVSGHTFMDATALARLVNHRLSVLPDWKQIEFREQYFEVDEEQYRRALYMTDEEGETYVYRREVYDDERLVEREIKQLLSRPQLQLRRPMTADDWRDYLFDRESVLARKAAQDYETAILTQVEGCKNIFTQPFSVLCGPAGTGKTTVLKSIIKGIRKVDGAAASVIAMAPTGKAADRAREIFAQDTVLGGSVETVTIHSFLAKRGWLNPNRTFKRAGGTSETSCQTIIIDECSMLDLHLFATLFRAIKWSTVKRLILVGDPNQLPPIGVGRVFADVVDYCRMKAPDALAELSANLRQLESKASGKGTGIIRLAGLYRTTTLVNEKDEGQEFEAEELLQQIQEGGDVDQDLRVVYWNEPEELAPLLIERLTQDMAEDAKVEPASLPFHDLWDKAFDWRPEYSQVLSPYRGELYGIEALNQAIQKQKSSTLLSKGTLDGITLFDKVIQIHNRTASEPIYGYNPATKHLEQVDVFNGELGFATVHGYDHKFWRMPDFRLKRFAVGFSRKGDIRINYGSDLGQLPNGKYVPNQKVEDNLELGYAISVHKAQGSEFDRIYVVVPSVNRQLLSQELLYTALTRGKRHCTLLLQHDVGQLIDMHRRERCWLAKINSSLLGLHIAPKELTQDLGWYEAGKIHQALTGDMVRSKSEVIIANLLHERDIEFRYEKPLYAPDGTMYLPDFTLTWAGEEWYWEHLGRLDLPQYKEKWEKKEKWYQKHFLGQLLVTSEGKDLSAQADAIVRTLTGT